MLTARSNLDNGVGLVNIRMSNPSGPFKSDELSFSNNLKKVGNSLRIVFGISSGVGTSGLKYCEATVETDSTYVLEAEFRRIGEDSLKVIPRVNGQMLSSLSIRLFAKPEFVDPINVLESDTIFSRFIVLSDIKTSKDMFVPVPPTPRGKSEKADTVSLTLRCESVKSSYAGEYVIATDWSICPYNNRDVSFFREIVDSPANLDSLMVYFPFDSGDYLWKARYKNNYGVWSSWSDFRKFSISHKRMPTTEVVSIDFVDTLHKKVEFLESGKWYTGVVKLKTAVPWKNFGYCLISFSRPDYPYGNQGNKLGRFYAGCNVIFNLSFIRNESGYFSYFPYEKNVEGSYRSEMIKPDSTGLYIDNRKGAISIDTNSSQFIFRFRIPEKSPAGLWNVKSYCVTSPPGNRLNRNERYSGLFRSSVEFKTATESRYSKKKLVIFTVIFIFAVVLVWVWKSRKKVVVSSPAPAVNNRLLDYLRENLHRDDLSRDVIIKEMKITRHQFYQLLSLEGDKKLPDIINEYRINRARELLLTTNKSIFEIALDCGFSDAGYFIKIFKSFEKLTPAEFRKKPSTPY
ncbi:MAG: helix-turn-helix transcriptional regulator [Fibrobacteres bacterium]|nr:helix-turn-helix transcriptional regulator [Fibrobacterota bacterium]